MTCSVHSLFSVSPNTPVAVIKAQQVLNVADVPRWQNAICRIVQSTPYWSLVAKDPEHAKLRAAAPEIDPFPDGYKLVAYAGVYGTLRPSYVQNGSWPYLPQATITIISPTSVELNYGGKTVTVDARIEGNLLIPEWPADIGIKGALQCPATPSINQKITIPTCSQYPVADVVKSISDNMDTYSLMEKHGNIDTFHFADSPAEKLSLLILSMAQEVNNG